MPIRELIRIKQMFGSVLKNPRPYKPTSQGADVREGGETELITNEVSYQGKGGIGKKFPPLPPIRGKRGIDTRRCAQAHADIYSQAGRLGETAPSTNTPIAGNRTSLERAWVSEVVVVSSHNEGDRCLRRWRDGVVPSVIQVLNSAWGVRDD